MNTLLGYLKIVVVAGAGACLMGSVMLVVWLLSIFRAQPPEGFDRNAWLITPLEAREKQGYPESAGFKRAGMVEDVMAHVLRRGMTRQAVIAQLGPAERDGVQCVLPDGVVMPDSLREEKAGANYRGWNAWYKQNCQPDTLLEYCVANGLWDPIYLHIKLGGNGRVVGYWTQQH